MPETILIILAVAWYIAIAWLVGIRSYNYARCGALEAFFSACLWPLWALGSVWRIGEESVGFRWGRPDEVAPDPALDPDADPAPAPRPESRVAPNLPLTATDKSKFLVELSMMDLHYEDAWDMLDMARERVAARSTG